MTSINTVDVLTIIDVIVDDGYATMGQERLEENKTCLDRQPLKKPV